MPALIDPTTVSFASLTDPTGTRVVEQSFEFDLTSTAKLLSRYRDRAAHDKERAEALKQVDEVIATAKRRVTDLQADRKKLDTEMEFYAADPNKAPFILKRKIADTDAAIETQKRFMVDQEAGKSRINARFDEELARLKVLWSAAGAPPAASTPSPAAAR